MLLEDALRCLQSFVFGQVITRQLSDASFYSYGLPSSRSDDEFNSSTNRSAPEGIAREYTESSGLRLGNFCRAKLLETHPLCG